MSSRSSNCPILVAVWESGDIILFLLGELQDRGDRLRIISKILLTTYQNLMILPPVPG